MGVAELQRAGLESGDAEQIIQHLHRELLEAQEMANTGKQRCLELQGNSSTNNPVSVNGKKHCCSYGIKSKEDGSYK